MGRYAIEDSSSEITIRWQGLPPLWPFRMVVLTFFVGVTCMAAGSAWVGLADKFAVIPLQAGVAIVVIAAFYLLICGVGFSIGAVFFNYWKWLRFHKQDGFSAHKASWYGFGGERRGAKAANIQRIELQLDSEGAARLPLMLTVWRESEIIPAQMELSIAHVDKRAEALDLLFRIGRLMGMKGYIVRSSGIRYLQVELVCETGDAEGVQSLPEATGTARYDLDQIQSAVEVPKVAVPVFDLETARRAMPLTKIVEWSPGDRVHFHRPIPPLSAFVIIGVVGSLIGSVAGFLPLPFNSWLMAGLGTVAGAGLICLYTFFQVRQREVYFDWAAGEVWWRVGGRLRRSPLSDIQELVLWGRHATRSIRNSSGHD
ncbi:MAG: hypothetical protein N2C14_32325, partial [Planctomycetales bacterium]